MPTSLLLILIFAVIGIIDTLYLVRHVITKTPVKCWWFRKEWCYKVQFSKYSRTLGIPNPILGLILYSLILFFALGLAGGGTLFWPIQVLVLIGLLFSLYFTYIQAFVLKAFCTWCVISALNFVVLTIATFLL